MEVRDLESHLESHLAKIFASAEFARSEQIRRFLRFVVTYAVEAPREQLKERLIGEKVFDRPADYDPKLDPIVRTEARRLRRKLQIYYDGEGLHDTIRIEIPKGGYLPHFEMRPVPESPAVETTATPAVTAEPATVAKWRRFAAPAILIVVATGLYTITAPNKNRSQADSAFEIVAFASEFGPEFSPAVSPDGKRIAYTWDGDADNFDIYVKTVDGGSRYRLTSDPAPDLSPAWSPDGGSIAFLRSSPQETTVLVKPADGGAERAVTRIETQNSHWISDSGPMMASPGPIWSRDGKRLIVSGFSQGNGLYQVSIETGKLEKLTSPPGVAQDFYPRLSPDGKLLAFARYFSHGLGELFVLSLSDVRLSQLTSDKRVIRGLSWAPDGRSLIFASNRAGGYRLWSLDLPGGAPQPISTNSSSAADPSAARTGNWMAYVETSENWNIWRARWNGTAIGDSKRFISSSGRNHTPRYSPDGATVAFVSDRSGSWEIWTCDPGGANARQLTHFNGPWLGGLNWSPDGTQLAFDARPNAHSGVFVLRVSGGSPRLLERNQFEERMPSWSRDGQFVYFNSNRGGSIGLWERDLVGGPATLVTKNAAFESSEAADGATLFFDVEGGGIWSSRPNGEGAAPVPALERVSPHLNWAVANNGIFFMNAENQLRSFWFYRFADGSVVDVGAASQPFVTDTPSLAVSPDGAWLLYAQQEHTSIDIRIRRAVASHP